MKWMCGITSCPRRWENGKLKDTLRSVSSAGFDQLVVFMDGQLVASPYFHLQEVVVRPRTLGAFGNFVLGLWELYLRNPNADRYIMFQDDVICCRNLRQYLERVPYPDHGYINLYTAGVNTGVKQGWQLSDQWGRGAVCLLFDNVTGRNFLGHEHFVNHRRNAHNGHKAIDRIINETAKKTNYREWVHVPSLTQHTGVQSSIGNNLAPNIVTAPSFVGEAFDAMSLLHFV